MSRSHHAHRRRHTFWLEQAQALGEQTGHLFLKQAKRDGNIDHHDAHDHHAQPVPEPPVLFDMF